MKEEQQLFDIRNPSNQIRQYPKEVVTHNYQDEEGADTAEKPSSSLLNGATLPSPREL